MGLEKIQPSTLPPTKILIKQYQILMKHLIRNSVTCCLAILLGNMLIAQSSERMPIPMTSEYWNTVDGNVEFLDYKSTRAVRSAEDAYFNIMAKDLDFGTGIIEYDVELVGRGFPGINFHIGPDSVNSEVYYLRYFGTPDPLSRTTMQYAAVMDGVNLWDITDEYQAGATVYEGQWNHVKLVISENQLIAYVNDMDQPALRVPYLEGIHSSGGISLSGNVIYANMVITPGETEGLPEQPGIDPAQNDPRYLRNWEVTEPVSLPFGRDVMMGIRFNPGVAIDTMLLNAETTWKPIQAGPRSMLNLTKAYGATEDGDRRLVWLKTTITSATAQEKLMELGFSDEVWVFINGSPVHIDKNYYGSPSMKEPRGRASLENASFTVPFQEGENELIIGVANYFFAWGVIARFSDTGGLEY